MYQSVFLDITQSYNSMSYQADKVWMSGDFKNLGSDLQ